MGHFVRGEAAGWITSALRSKGKVVSVGWVFLGLGFNGIGFQWVGFQWVGFQWFGFQWD